MINNKYKPIRYRSEDHHARSIDLYQLSKIQLKLARCCTFRWGYEVHGSPCQVPSSFLFLPMWVMSPTTALRELKVLVLSLCSLSIARLSCCCCSIVGVLSLRGGWQHSGWSMARIIFMTGRRRELWSQLRSTFRWIERQRCMEQWPWCCLGGCDGYRRRWREALQSERDESRVVAVFSFMTFFFNSSPHFFLLPIFLSFLISARFSSSLFFFSRFFFLFKVRIDFVF